MGDEHDPPAGHEDPPPEGGGHEGEGEGGGQAGGSEQCRPAPKVEDLVTPDVDSTVGSLQRLRIHVPTFETTLSLGRANGAVGYDGISGVTEKDVFFSAQEGKMTFQSEKQGVVQAMENLFVVSKDELMMGSVKETFIAGKTGVVIAAGAGPAPVMLSHEGTTAEELHFNTVEDLHKAAEDANHRAETIANTATITAAIVGGLAGTADLQFGFGAMLSSIGAMAPAAEGTASLGLVATNELFASGAKGAVLRGGTSAAVIGGLQAEMLGGAKVEIAGGALAIVLAGGKAAVEAGYKAELLGGVKAEVAARRGTAEVIGKAVEIGTVWPGATQSTTLTSALISKDKTEVIATTGVVEVMGGKEIKLASGAVNVPDPSILAGLPTTVESKASLELSGEHSKAVLEAHSKIEIAVGHFKIVVDGKGKKILIGKAAKEDGEPEDPIIEIDGASNKITIGAEKCGMTVTSKRAALGTESHYVAVESSGKLTLKGMTLNLL